MRVLAAMSGGVDSAVAAARAVDAGHDVVGVHMALSRTPAQERTGSRGCCSIEDASDARRAADVLGIPYYVWDMSERFEATVVADFLSEYAAGRTPNPCVRCNEHVKFAALLDKAVALGFDAVCTGHYARVVEGADGVRELHRAADAAKDQSYVLAVMGPERLARAVFPLGDVTSKAEVRAEAVARGLSVAAKPDSYDICFVADGDTQGFLRRALGEQPGDIVDEDGAVVGTHDGAYAYTVGQRRGLSLGRPAPDGRPRYVLAVEPVRRRVVVGPAEHLDVAHVRGDAAVWFGAVPSAGTSCTVQVRAHGADVPARVLAADAASVTVDVADGGVRGVAPGQSLVLYDGSRVLGQATVAGTRTAADLAGAASDGAA
ncbi:tRNA 2-thiouridine(34) synthase MnmA [Cellulomonas sp. zg-ZUI222]|uniref:tRNA-specific 2-thiouridylase MnmA n=1 Tax=Cellulomonas wangleii TaxID=2816956 RepID=A0ABX8D7H8_9CELL|nr:tRNA 2-thiouridine(34) synthase MnmA [Cellulomonas wangleii]MBO0921723.1 tRNA 2-thiouridine(34) synthase MnmA [Cellulomonas wangleii]MBO0925212.1 tRNA 2-thiouridine(34) synthase MnmA [Cellulomonas wangleii]QVI63390.1 tRNA 2-thiouridine(34) synthase MnmA [Cellulomonas wangleii]